MTIRLLSVGALMCLICATPVHADFIGNLKLGPPGCENTELCTVLENFGYEDPYDRGWQAQKGNKTDGASIPKWAQRFVGEPYDKRYIRAAVLHDHYCDRRVRSWFLTHRMFYSALRDSGVSRTRAQVLYAAVLLGGPKWIWTIEPRRCDDTVDLCIQNLPKQTEITRDETYEDPEFANDWSAVRDFLAANPEAEIEEIDAFVTRLRPNDIFLQNPDGVAITNFPYAPFFQQR